MAATYRTSFSTRLMNLALCAPAHAYGLESAPLSTVSRKKTLPHMAGSMAQKTTSGALVSYPADSCLRRAITKFQLSAVFSANNAKSCSVTEPDLQTRFDFSRETRTLGTWS